jgi:hypothetical protein
MQIQFHLHGTGGKGRGFNQMLPAFKFESLQSALEAPNFSENHWSLGSNGTIELNPAGVPAEITH